MKIIKIILLTILFAIVLPGCKEHDVYLYKSYDNREYGSTGGAIKVIDEKDGWFTRRGYRKIALIGVKQKVAECFNDKCKRFTYKKSITDCLAEEGAAKGGHIVQLVQKAAIQKNKIENSTLDCEKWGSKRVKVYKTTCRGGQVGSGTVRDCTTRTEYRTERTCLEYKKETGEVHILWTAGTLWRKN